MIFFIDCYMERSILNTKMVLLEYHALKLLNMKMFTFLLAINGYKLVLKTISFKLVHHAI